jgi:ATP-dependent DNA ligase
MDLPVSPPLPPMLASRARELPTGPFLYEPKWDGFRCLAFRSGREVDLRSRNDRPLARYFPEIVEGLRSLAADRFALDGELVVATPQGFDFAALLARLHPAASRVERLSSETPAWFIAFDVLAVESDELLQCAFAERRSRLEALLADARPPVHLTPITDDQAVASAWLDRFHGAGVDGVVAKARDAAYQPGARVMVKVKREHTADCVVAGFRWLVDRPLPSSLLLGLYDGDELEHIGIAS